MTAPLRMVVTGKGGVGKTTLTATLSRVLARRGHSVLAVDGDAQCNLARTLGMPAADAERIVPLSRNAGYTEQAAGPSGGLVRLNPDVSDVVDRFAVTAPDGVRLLVMGGLDAAGGGCLCPENSVLAATVAQLGRDAADVVILDTQAGVEHFGRALARGFDIALVVTDPTSNALAVAGRTARLARDLGLPRVVLAVNRSRNGFERRPVDATADVDEVFHLPYDDVVLDTEPSVDAVVGAVDGAVDGRSAFAAAVALLADTLVAAGTEAVACTP